MTADRRIVERRGALVDEVALANWIGDMDRRAAERRKPVARLSLTLLADRTPRPAVQPDLAGARGAASRDVVARSIEAPEPIRVPHRTSACSCVDVPAATAGDNPQTPPAVAASTHPDPASGSGARRVSSAGPARIARQSRASAPAVPVTAGG